ncbi:RhoGAP-domain-containing protein [Periconia macrospinosa]|uniref:RhoGAP-domain-containing protein n=1 Tax=Periconia macrospinosa TaxID=97972 RepID=A0A2V1DWV1_9PLEO|nr:RhoGAP-domain-containing protein [Periconia macrospinosa]
MPHGAHNHGPLSTPRARNGEPTPAVEPASAKRDLTSWWKQFSKRNMKKEEEKGMPQPEPSRGIFGVPLITSIPYANVAISLFNENGESYIYGYVPIVVAKCGVFLKEKATDVEGIFRLAGSEKRIKELKAQFDAPPRWGKGLDWSGYTVHDAANILRRYFNQLPEPIIPLQYYDRFRAPLRGHQAEAVGPIEGQSPSVGGFDPDNAVHIYQQCIKELPSLNRQLLLYILDLLAVFAAKAETNKMTTSNLAAIFQPGILSHPQHDMSPQDYRLSQDVLIFLIDNQDHFLIGMEGTAVDEGTARHVESGPSTPQARTPTTPVRNQNSLGRSASAASSAAAESVRRFGDIRRNVSTSSRRSRHSGVVPSPTTPSYTSGSGVHRSNTVPSKRSPALPASHFTREKTSDPTTPSAEDKNAQLPPAVTAFPAHAAGAADASNQAAFAAIPPVDSAHRLLTPPTERLDVVKLQPPTHIQMPPSAVPTPGLEIPGAFIPSPAIAPPGGELITPAASAQAAQALAPPTEHQPRRSPQTTPKHERSEFVEGPIDNGTPVEPTPAVRTFTQILAKASPDEKSSGRKPNKLQKRRGPSANPSAQSSTHSLSGTHPPTAFDVSPSPLPQSSIPHSHPASSKETSQAYNSDTVSSRNSGATLKPSMSPSASFRSHSTATEYSEPEDVPKEEKMSFWKSHRRGESKATPTASQTDLHGSIPNADKSMSSIGSSSGGGGGRRSLQYDSHQSSDLSVAYGDGKDHNERKSPFDWFNKKRQEHKERADKRQRAKSPPGSTNDLSQQHGLVTPRDDLAVRGRRSLDASRPTESQDSSDVTPTAVTPNPLKTTPSPPAQAMQQSMPHTTTPPTAAPTNVAAEKQPVLGPPHAVSAAPTAAHVKEPAVVPAVDSVTKPEEPAVKPALPTANITGGSTPSTPVKSLLDIGLEASKAGATATGEAANAQDPAHHPTST